jgi:hypothetical protein
MLSFELVTAFAAEFSARGRSASSRQLSRLALFSSSKWLCLDEPFASVMHHSIRLMTCALH